MAETTNGGSAGGEGSGGASPGGHGAGGAGKALKRYGPILLVVVIIAAVIAVAAGGNDDDDATTDTTTGDNSDLPQTYQEALDAGTEGDTDWGDTCDTELGTVKVPIT